MEGDETRQRLDQMILAARLSYAEVSRAIGRNPAYIQQFIKRGVPRRLPEAERRALASLLGVEEAALGGPVAVAPAPQVHMIAEIGNEATGSGRKLPLDRQFAIDISAGRPDDLQFFQVEGDAMVPTLRPGDQVLVRPLREGEVHDGLHLLQWRGGRFVRRLAPHPVTGRISVLCDNPGYPPLADQERDKLQVMGRIVWMGRRLD